MFAAFAANVGIAITKLIAFLITGSASMLAEFVHSCADCSDQILLLVGRRRARRGETEEHPFGFGRERYFYGFLVSVVLFSVGGAYSVYDGIHKIINPEPITDAYIAFIVLAASTVLEGSSLRTAIKESNEHRHGAGWLSFILRAKGPDLFIVLLEDSAALVGLAFAFLGIGLAVLTGNGAWDGAGSVAIGVLLAGVAIVVARETKSLLIGEAATNEAERTIVNALEDGPEVERVIHMRTVHLSPDALLVAAKVAVRAEDTAETVVRGIDAAERRVRAALPMAEVIYLEPDIYQESKADLTDPAIRTVSRAWGDYTGPDGPRGTGPQPTAAGDAGPQPTAAGDAGPQPTAPGEHPQPAPAPAPQDQREPSPLPARGPVTPVPVAPAAPKVPAATAVLAAPAVPPGTAVLAAPEVLAGTAGPLCPAGRPSSRRARSCSKSRARPGCSGSRPRRRLRSATATRTAGSDSTRSPNAMAAGLTW